MGAGRASLQHDRLAPCLRLNRSNNHSTCRLILIRGTSLTSARQRSGSCLIAPRISEVFRSAAALHVAVARWLLGFARLLKNILLWCVHSRHDPTELLAEIERGMRRRRKGTLERQCLFVADSKETARWLSFEISGFCPRWSVTIVAMGWMAPGY